MHEVFQVFEISESVVVYFDHVLSRRTVLQNPPIAHQQLNCQKTVLRVQIHHHQVPEFLLLFLYFDPNVVATWLVDLEQQQQRIDKKPFATQFRIKMIILLYCLFFLVLLNNNTEAKLRFAKVATQ